MKIFVLPDVQARDGNDFTFLSYIGQYIVDKQPDIVLCLGDFADMSSLSTFDRGTRVFEGLRYTSDIGAAQQAMMTLMQPLEDYNHKQLKAKHAPYRPKQIMLYGNHEDRIDRAANRDAKLTGLISLNDLAYEAWGWECHPFLEVVVIEGVAFSHYFISGVKGLPIATATLQLNKMHMSCVAGHQQGKQIATGRRADGKLLTSIISGSCYEHYEDYMGQQGNKHWRGCFMLHQVDQGSFDEMFVSLSYLKDKYGKS